VPSLDRLVLESLPDALRFATRLTGNLDNAEDLVSEALVRAVRRWSTFRGEASFKTWFLKILINVFRDRNAGTAAAEIRLAAQEEPGDHGMGDPAAAVIAMELEERVAAEVSRLPPRQREVLVLVVYEGLATTEIADVLGITPANVHATLSLARQRLKARLPQYFGPIGK
jgi:RNA polymerase sigma-70 factor (ECF subfamily)